MSRKFNPRPDEIENAMPHRITPKLYQFTDDEKAKVRRWLERQIVSFEFRMEEMGKKPEAIIVRKWWTNQMKYYRHARKFCRYLLHQLDRRDNFMESERD